MNRTCLITGVSGGIGSATASLFADNGWRVVGVDLRAVRPNSVVHEFYQADVSDPQAVDQIFASISTGGFGLHALVNNAAVQLCKPLVDTSPDEWDRVLNCNLRSVYLMSRAAIPSLLESRGGIINVSSVHALATSVNMSAYAAAKGGVVALTKSLALELAPYIRVNAVLPGAVDTKMLRDGISRGHLAGETSELQLKQLATRTPLGRIGGAAEIAQAVFFLADTTRSSFMTGQSLVIDGGALARLSTE